MELRTLALPGGVVAGIAVGLACAWVGLAAAACWTAAITVLVAVWWVTEPLPIPVTSIVPFVAFPLAGVLDEKTVATAYGHHLILLLLGGFVLSTSMEKSGVHRRLALGMIRLVGGTSPRRLVLGFMLATAVCSMWISNTATTLMLLPVAIAVIERDPTERIAAPLLLGIAYAASIGGIGTPVGTPPNIIFMGFYREVTGVDIGFARWMAIGVPIVALMLPLAWLRITWRLHDPGGPQDVGGGLTALSGATGPWRPVERRVLGVFALTALAWVTRTAPFGGWAALTGISGAGDSTVALAAVVLLFLLPDGEGGKLLDWPTAVKIPWGLLLLFGGGIAIARAFEASHLDEALGHALGGLTALRPLAMILSICLAVTFLTEVTSNTATATLLMPVLAAAAGTAGIEPARMMAPAAISASCAFMLPVATAPNAIVFGTDRVPIRTMAREGLVLNLVGAVVITAVCLATL